MRMSSSAVGWLVPYGGSNTVRVTDTKRGDNPTTALSQQLCREAGLFPASRTQQTVFRGAGKGSGQVNTGERAAAAGLGALSRSLAAALAGAMHCSSHVSPARLSTSNSKQLRKGHILNWSSSAQ